MLPIYEKCKRIKEIIIIDNDISKRPKLIGFKKIIYLPQEQNIFVNPAWNLGASLAKHEIILANDDVIIDDLEGLLDIFDKSEYTMIGADILKRGCQKGETACLRFPANSFGCFLRIKNYLYIPEQMKIWRGDWFLYDHSRVSWVAGYIETPMATTVNDASCNFMPQCHKDKREYDKLKSKELNIIIRTSNRPNYFRNCIASVKRYAPNAQIHVTVDNENDLAYVKHFAPDCSYYLINRDTIQNFANKQVIERKPFIYNLYLNVVKPFLKGSCMILDDDCQLMASPKLTKKGQIILSKVDIRKRIVPVKFKQEPKFTDIDMGGIMFHSEDMVDFRPQRGGDFDFIKEMYDKCTTVWNDEVIVQMQTGLNHGKRNDLKTDPVKINIKQNRITLNAYKANKNENISFPMTIDWQFEDSIMTEYYEDKKQYVKDCDKLIAFYK